MSQLVFKEKRFYYNKNKKDKNDIESAKKGKRRLW